MSERKHLLIKGEHRVWCTGKKPSDSLDITMYPSKTTCAICLTKYRRSTRPTAKFVKTYHTADYDFDRWSNPDNQYGDRTP